MGVSRTDHAHSMDLQAAFQVAPALFVLATLALAGSTAGTLYMARVFRGREQAMVAQLRRRTHSCALLLERGRALVDALEQRGAAHPELAESLAGIDIDEPGTAELFAADWLGMESRGPATTRDDLGLDAQRGSGVAEPAGAAAELQEKEQELRGLRGELALDAARIGQLELALEDSGERCSQASSRASELEALCQGLETKLEEAREHSARLDEQLGARVDRECSLLDRLQAQEDRTEELAATLVQRDQELEECLARLEYGERELGRMDQLLDRSEGELEQRGDELSDMQRLVEHYHAVAAGEGAGLDEVEELLERLRPQLGRL